MKHLLKWCVVCVVLASGCSGPRTDYGMVDLVQVQGTIRLDGQPLPSAVVTFEDPTDDTFSYGLTDAQGRYRLQFDSQMSGVKTGAKVVRISTTRKLLGLNTKPGQEGTDAAEGETKELVPPRYNKKSELQVQVETSTKQHDFELTSKS